MRNRIFILSIVSLCAGCTPDLSTPYRTGSTVQGGADVMEVGSLAGIKIGDTEAEVSAAAAREDFGKALKGKDEVWEAIGLAVQTWNYPDVGLSVDMGSEQIGGKKSVFSITLEAPSMLKTGRGIGIGATRAQVIDAYAGFKNEPGESLGEPANYQLVGSIYGGMAFSLKDEKVTRIFLGASAE